MNKQRTMAYGDPLAGGPLDIIAFFKKPLVICRIFSLIISIIVFSTVLSGAWNSNECIINKIASNCNFIVAVGIVSLMAAITFLSTDFVMPHISSLEVRKIIVVTDIIFSCIYVILWLVATGVIIGEWWKTLPDVLRSVQAWQYMCIQTAAAFCIFGIADWILITALAARRFHSSRTDMFLQQNEINRVENRNYHGDVNGNNSDHRIQRTTPPATISGEMNKNNRQQSNEYAKFPAKY